MYTLTFKVRENRTSIIHPKWWQFWKKAKFKSEGFTTIKNIRLPFSEKQCKQFTNSPVFTHLLTNLYGGFSDVELKKGARADVYHDVDGNIVEDKITD